MIFRKNALRELRGDKPIEKFLREFDIPCVVSAWWKWENGESTPKASFVGLLAGKFTKPVDFFYQEACLIK